MHAMRVLEEDLEVAIQKLHQMVALLVGDYNKHAPTVLKEVVAKIRKKHQ